MPIDGNAISQRSREYNVFFPLFFFNGIFGMQHNFSQSFLVKIQNGTGLRYSEKENRDKQRTFDAYDLFGYIYAVLWSPFYRNSFAEELRKDFARIPTQISAKFFFSLSTLGIQLLNLHLGGEQKTSACCSFKKTIDCVPFQLLTYDEEKKALFLNSEFCFENLSRAAFELKIGSSSLCQKWISDKTRERKELKNCYLTIEEVHEFAKILGMLNETVLIMSELEHFELSDLTHGIFQNTLFDTLDKVV